MAKPNPHRPFHPDPEQMALVPEISGNTVNGLGEEDLRPPRMVYWAPDMSQIPHGGLQGYFYKRSSLEPAFGDARAARQEILQTPLPEVASSRVEQSAEAWTEALTRFVEDGTCEMTGVARMQDDWIFEDHEITQSKVIMLGVQHGYAPISTAPEVTAGLEVMAQYARAAKAAILSLIHI